MARKTANVASGTLGRVRPTYYAFKLGFLKSYGAEYGAAHLNCSGSCSCAPTWLDARAGPRDRHRVSLHSIENVVLSTRPQRSPDCCVVTIETFLASALPPPAAKAAGRAGVKAAASEGSKRMRRRGTASVDSGGLRLGGGEAGVGVQRVGAAMKFKVLSFFVGPTVAGKGRLHQQSIVISEDAGLGT